MRHHYRGIDTDESGKDPAGTPISQWVMLSNVITRKYVKSRGDELAGDEGIAAVWVKTEITVTSLDRE